MLTHTHTDRHTHTRRQKQLDRDTLPSAKPAGIMLGHRDTVLVGIIHLFHYSMHRLAIITDQRLHDLDCDLEGHSRSNAMVYIENPHMTSYSSSIVTMVLSGTV